ncbi:MAG: hypothetical protein WBH85_14305 [Thermoanaerobaculia bacterium]
MDYDAMKPRVGSPVVVGLFLVLVGPLLLFGCAQPAVETDMSVQAEAEQTALFTYEPAELPTAKPWTSGEFKNNPEEFQFVIIGDRTGGANVAGTFALAIGQLNLRSRSSSSTSAI